MRLPVVAVVAVVAVLAATAASCSCGDKRAKQDQADLAKAKALMTEALARVAEGKLEEASAPYQTARDLLHATRLRARKPSMGEEDLPDGPLYLGRSARAWGEAWEQDMAEAVEVNLDALRARTVAGEISWVKARDLVAQYGGRAAEARFGEARPAATAAAAARSAGALVLRCDSPGDDAYCDEVKRLLVPKLARPVSPEGASPEVRAAAVGVVDVAVRTVADDYVQVGGKDNPGGVVVARPARALELVVKTTTNRGRSSWDGTQVLRVEHAPPKAYDVTEMTAVATAQTAELRRKMREAVGALPAQTLSP